MKTILLFLITLLSANITYGQQMITEFLSASGDKSSSPNGFIEFNEKFFFSARTEIHGNEIWVSNGNPNSAFLLKDINVGTGNGAPNLSQASVILNNMLYFIGNDGITNGELWKTDGTTSGTKKVTNFLNSNITKLTLIGNKIFFLIKIDDTLQVWTSDGTTAGTVLVKDNLDAWNTPTFQGKCNTTFIFTFQPYGTNNSRVWRSDGTSEGTYPITDEIDGNGAGPGGTSALTQYIELNDELFFVSRYYLHKTDGTLENTSSITTLHNAGSSLVDYADAVVANEKLYFSFFQLQYNRLFIWESDGSVSGTTQIYDHSDPEYFMTSNFLGLGSQLLFCSGNNSGGTSLFSMNLENYSVSAIKELQQNKIKPSFFNYFRDAINLQNTTTNGLYLSVPNNSSGRHGWISGLTESTTLQLDDFDNVNSVFTFNNDFFFSKNTPDIGNELWKSVDPISGITLSDNINKSKYGLNQNLLSVLNSRLIFNANNGTIGDELWMYDQSTVLLKDIQPGAIGSNSKNHIKFNGEIYFTSNDNTHGNELWKTNGQEMGTTLVFDIVEGFGSSSPTLLTLHKNNLYFFVSKVNRYFLCKTDGTTIEFIKDLGVNQYDYPFTPMEMASSGEVLYFVSNGEGEDLWLSNGTELGTHKIKDFNTCNTLTDVNGELFFSASETYMGATELWVSNGTESETKLVKDIGIDYSSFPKELFSYNDKLFFTAYTLENGREIWLSDGTESGTQMLKEVNPGNQSGLKNANFCTWNNELFFSGGDETNGFELWKTDGTQSGTHMVKDINTGIEGSFPSQTISTEDALYFQAYDAEHGFELWKSDGTSEGTVFHADILVGPESSSPTNLISISENIFCIAESREKGRQIWKVPFNLITTLSENLLDTQPILYPNPVEGLIKININELVDQIQIYNLNGQFITRMTMHNNTAHISHLPKGLYLARFSLKGKVFTQKIIKK